MFNKEEEGFHENQVKILKLLLEKPYLQKDLAAEMKISGAGLLYHINILEKHKLVSKEILATVGNVSLKRISIHPNAIQRARMITGMSMGTYTLISGMGKDINDWTPSEIPAQAKKLLESEGYKISRIVAFAEKDSNIEHAKTLVTLDKTIIHSYLDYRNDASGFFTTLEKLIHDEMREGNLILDLTPLTKLLTIKLLELSTKYRIPSFYLGRKEGGDYYLIWIYNQNR